MFSEKGPITFVVLVLLLGLFFSYNVSKDLDMQPAVKADHTTSHIHFNAMDFNNTNCQKLDISLLKETSSEKHLIYNRVPQCGSKGMRLLFAKLGRIHKYSVQYDKGIDHHQDSNASIEALALRISNLHEPWIYIRHLDFIDFSAYGKETPHYVNIIRDPMDQMVSSFYFLRGIMYRGKSQNAMKYNITFDECLEKTALDDCRVPMRRMLSFFCGQQKFCLKASRKTLEQAKVNVLKYYPIVGYLEAVDKFLQILELLWPQFFKNASKTYIKLKQKGVGKHENFIYDSKPKPSEKTKAIILPSLKYDYEFYDFIKNRFDCMYDYIIKRYKT